MYAAGALNYMITPTVLVPLFIMCLHIKRITHDMFHKHETCYNHLFIPMFTEYKNVYHAEEITMKSHGLHLLSNIKP